jgi:CheY-like chemotaxis protein
MHKIQTQRMGSLNGKYILIVDDDEDIVLVFKTYLEEAGCYVDSYTSPLRALSEFKSNKYDLILLDVRMPNMNGFQLYKRLRKVDENCKVCFITAFEPYYQALRESFPKLDVSCFIKKPMSGFKLLERLAHEIN